MGKLKQTASKIFHTLFVLIFIFTSTLGALLQPGTRQIVQAAELHDTATRTPWPDSEHNTLSRDGIVYELYVAMQDGAELGLYAVEQSTGQRVQNHELEQSLIYEAATVDKWFHQPYEILIPVSSYPVVPNAEYTSVYEHTFTHEGPPPGSGLLPSRCLAGTFSADIPDFIAFDEGSLFEEPSWEQLMGYPEFFSSLVDPWWHGLSCSEIQARTYGRVILKSVLQEIFSPQMQQHYLDMAGELLLETRERLPTTLSSLGILRDIEEALVEGYVEANYVVPSDDLMEIYKATEHQAFLKRGMGFSKFVGAGLSVLSSTLAYIEHDQNISTRALLISVQREYLLADAEYRLYLLESYFDNYQGEVPPALHDGIEKAIEAFQLLKDKDIEARTLVLEDETIQLSALKLSLEIGNSILVLGSLIPWAGIGATLSTITLPVGIVVFVITTFVIPYITEKIEYLELLREMSVAYTLSIAIAESLPGAGESFPQFHNITELMTILNIAWYSRMLYYHAIGDYRPDIDPDDWRGLIPDNPESEWLFNEPDGTQTRTLVNTEASSGFGTAYNQVELTSEGYYLDEQERDDLKSRQLAQGAENNFAFGTGQMPFPGQNFVKGSVVPLALEAYADAGVIYVSFYVYPEGGTVGAPYCTDSDGPNLDGYWTCPTSPGWDTFGITPGAYFVQAKAVNTLDIPQFLFDPIAINVVQPDDEVSVNLTLDPSSLTVDDTFNASGRVLLNDQGGTFQVKLEIVGTGIQSTKFSNNDGTYTFSNISVPQSAGNYWVKVTGSTAESAGYALAELGVSASPVAGNELVITDYQVSDHVEPGDDARLRAFVHNQGTTTMQFRLRYELRNPSDGLVDWYDGPLTTLAPGQVYPGLSADVQYLGPTTVNGTYTAIAMLVDSNGNPVNNWDPSNNRREIGVLVSDTTDFDQYIYNEGLYADTEGTIAATTLASSFTVRIIASNSSATRAQIEIKRNGTTINDTSYWYYESREYYEAGNSVFFYIFDIEHYGDYQSRMWLALGEATSHNFSVRPSNPILAKAGSDAVLVLSAPQRMYNVEVAFGPDADEVKDLWDPDDTRRNDAGTLYDLELDVPLPPNVNIGETYVFFASMDYGGSLGYLQKVEVDVIAPDDVAVSALTPGNGTQYLVGDAVPVVATIQNNTSYFESEVPVSLRVTGPGGYVHENGLAISALAGLTSQPVNFSWSTSGLPAGTYTLQVSTGLASDPYTSNNSLARTITLAQKPTLSVVAGTGGSIFGQNESILLSASVTDPALTAVPGALVYAHITGPSVDETQVMAYNATAQAYEIALAYPNLGTYQYTVRATKEGYLEGETAAPGSFTVVNAPPDTWISTASVEAGGWTNQDSVTISWNGSDTATSADALQYRTRLDSGSWSGYSGTTQVTLTGLVEGPHTFDVQAYDGSDPDPTPAQYPFNIDTIAPAFEAAPSANLSQAANSQTLQITLDLDETITPSLLLSALDSQFTPTAVSIQEIDPGNHVYQLSYEISTTNWRPDGLYTLPVNIVDQAGNRSSNYALSVRLENQAPTITTYWPAWESDIPQDEAVLVVFSEEMNPAQAELAFQIEPAVAGGFLWDNPRTLVFTPTQDLEIETTYTVTLTTAAVDLAGKPLTPKTWNFTTASKPAAFNKTNPEPGETWVTTAPTLVWESSNGAEGYEYCLDTSEDDTCEAGWVDVGLNTSVTLASLAEQETYYWQVRAYAESKYKEADQGTWWQFTTQGGPPLPFNKLEPTQGATSVSFDPTLEWESSIGAASYQYCLDTSDNNTCDASWTSVGDHTSITLSGLAPGGTYTWQVRAVNTDGSTEADGGSWWTFTLQGNEPAAFGKTSPADLATEPTIYPTLAWSPSDRAEDYQYCLDTIDNGTCDSAWTSIGNTTSVALAGLDYATPYFWQVRATNSSGTTEADAGDWWQFTTRDLVCYTLTLNHTGTGSDPSPSPTNTIGCAPGGYAEGETITLAATPDSNWQVGSWSGTDQDSVRWQVNSLSMPASHHTTTVNYVPASTWSLVDTGQAFGSAYTDQVVLGDLDGDGDLDLVEASMGWATNDSKINRVWFNNGSGVFTDSGQTLGIYVTKDIALGDLDADGDLDLIEANSDAGYNRVYFNAGNGTFTWSGQALGSNYNSFVAIGDIDNDGDLDFVVARENYNPNMVFINDGSGTFVDSGQRLGSDSTRSVQLADVDLDGDLDMAAGNYGANRIYFNDGTGLFTDSGQLLGDHNMLEIALGDLNGDGFPDLVEGVIYGDYANRVYLNDGSGFFSDTGQLLGSVNTRSVALGDMDNDGDLDLVAGNNQTTNDILLNDGTGQFHDAGIPFGGNYSISVILGDIDNDGDLDVVEGNYGGGATSCPNKVYRNTLAASQPNTNPGMPSDLSWQPSGIGMGTFHWDFGLDTETHPTGISYNLRLGTTSGGQDLISGLTPAAPGWVGAAMSKLIQGLDPGTYYWSVRSVDAGFAVSDWASEAQFTIVPPPGTFTKVEPADAAPGVSTNPMLTWSTSADATSYQYCYDTSDDNACTNWLSTGTGTSVNLVGLNPGTTYYWQVRASNTVATTYANGSSSAFWSFTVQPEELEYRVFLPLLKK